VKYSYRPFPLSHVDPVTKLDYAWRPALKVLLWYQHKKSPPIESILDTGADHCVFDAQIAEGLGIPVTKGMPVAFTGIEGRETVRFLHHVTLTVAAQTFQAPIVFAYGILTTGILGQTGFFDHFVATFDWTPDQQTGQPCLPWSVIVLGEIL
jgi:hypothetical protein